MLSFLKRKNNLLFLQVPISTAVISGEEQNTGKVLPFSQCWSSIRVHSLQGHGVHSIFQATRKPISIFSFPFRQDSPLECMIIIIRISIISTFQKPQEAMPLK